MVCLNLLIFLAPALILSFVAQMMIKSAYSRTSQIEARTSGFQAARRMLEASGFGDWQEPWYNAPALPGRAVILSGSGPRQDAPLPD